jgi:predicted dehydrogenase
VALIGAGAMGSLHARVVSQHPQVQLAAIVDIDEDAGRALADRFDCAYRCDLDSQAFDAVIVASPTETHFAWVSQALELRLPVLVEKPMASVLADTRRMIDRAAALDVPLMCGFIERFNAAVMLATEIVKSPLYVQAFRHSPYVPRIRGGVAGDLLIHDVDLALRFFGGAPLDVQARLGFFHPQSEAGAEDVAEAQLSFSGGGLAALSASRIGQQKIRQLRVHDLDRMLEVDLVRQDITVLRHVDNEFDESGAYRQQTVIDVPAIPNRREPLLTQLDYFIAMIDGQRDHAAERATLLAPHEVIALVLAGARPQRG